MHLRKSIAVPLLHRRATLAARLGPAGDLREGPVTSLLMIQVSLIE
jgi:hypothetical protein